MIVYPAPLYLGLGARQEHQHAVRLHIDARPACEVVRVGKLWISGAVEMSSAARCLHVSKDADTKGREHHTYVISIGTIARININ
jgi:hypothetical protein